MNKEQRKAKKTSKVKSKRKKFIRVRNEERVKRVKIESERKLQYRFARAVRRIKREEQGLNEPDSITMKSVAK